MTRGRCGSLIHFRMTFAFTTPRRFNRRTGDTVMKNKIWKIVVPVLLIAVFVAWYAFRPERLFLNEYVDEKLPAANNGSPPERLESDTFHSVLHPTQGTATVFRIPDGNRSIP